MKYFDRYEFESSHRPLEQISKEPVRNPMNYVAGELVQALREYFVKDPQGPEYQIASTAARVVLQEPRSVQDIFIREVLSIGAYLALKR